MEACRNFNENYLLNSLAMAGQRRKFSDEEKRSILQLANNTGVTKVLHEYKLSYSVFSRWKQQFGLSVPSSTEAYLSDLRQENTRLKKIIAEQALELEIKKEQLKR